jgi:hypothetical protein
MLLDAVRRWPPTVTVALLVQTGRQLSTRFEATLVDGS